MKFLKKLSILLVTGLTAFTLTAQNISFADAVAGETVVTFGQDLSAADKQTLMTEMKVDDKVKQVSVTNQEEHTYLGKYLSKAVIGNRALSSAKITLTDSGKGIAVKTNNITNISPAMYANAAITAGVKDADIYVTAPFKVSGTAALTGIIKAFEKATGQKIDENKKQVANEEMVRTQDIAEKTGITGDKAAQFINKVKEEIATQSPKTVEEYKNIIVNISNQFNINLDQATIDNLVQFSQNFSSLNIDWGAISGQLDKLRGDISKVLSSDEAKGFLDSILEWIASIFRAIADFFSSIFK
ncbi:Uncharacterized protein YpuA, DUF1002 family [Thermoactinomyces sp. DSM 45891]|uniref:DUF1002 domain-containing protein n=1 Tax=Thermoactinomyces sp. DSM 45891 TaxID=1761907 RepID=UPI000912F4E1|nr:DUF1002 domain-containing protein [Thermoactinomyces sp. DSM 45891]SFX64690.1 Uncharacterized protein YpuA, DUF1002 family [Thermoactinomyces sp. DSM 45891]